MTVERLTGRHGPGAIALLDELHVELLGIRSHRLHAALVADALRGVTDCRIARDEGRLLGIVLAATPAYWWMLPATHWNVAAEILRARHRRASGSAVPGACGAHPRVDAGPSLATAVEPPPRTWRSPGDAWRIVFVGTAPAARGRGVAAALYRHLMADRSLVARIALENSASLRLHRSVGWQLYRDGDVALAVHLRRSTLDACLATTPGAGHS